MSAKKRTPPSVAQGSLKPSAPGAPKAGSPFPPDGVSADAKKRDWSKWLGMPLPTDGASPSSLPDLGFPEFPPPHQPSPEVIAMLMPGPKRRASKTSILLKLSKTRPSHYSDESESNGKKIEVADHDILRKEFPSLKPPQLLEVERLLKEADYQPSEETRSSESWWMLPEILAGMPFHFRRLAMYKFREGIRVFGKIPVRKQTEQSANSPTPSSKTSITGPARPMGCPEAPPEGSTFILAWREGEFWNWNLADFEYDWKVVTPNRFHPRLRNECGKYIQCLSNHVEQGDPTIAAVARGILGILDQHQHPRESNKPTDLEKGLYAGVLLARQLIYRSADDRYAEKIETRKSAWPDILRHAFQRHGWELPNDKLLTAINGQRKDTGAEKVNAKVHQIVIFPKWQYVPNEGILTYGQFQKKASDLRSEYRAMSKPDAIPVRMRGLLDRPSKKSFNGSAQDGE